MNNMELRPEPATEFMIRVMENMDEVTEVVVIMRKTGQMLTVANFTNNPLLLGFLETAKAYLLDDMCKDSQ